MNKPFYKSTGVMGSLSGIVGCLVALVASLAAMRGMEISTEAQAQIVALVMALAGGVASLIGRLKATDVIGADIITCEAFSVPGFTGVQPDTPWERPTSEKLSPPLPRPASPGDEECPAAGAASPKQADLQESQADVIARLLRQAQEKPAPQLVGAYQVIGVAEKFRSEVPLNAEDLSTIRQFLTAIGCMKPFVKDQAGCPSKDPASMAEGQLVGDQSTVISNG